MKHTILILDFDDTLFPSTTIDVKQCEKIDDEFLELIQKHLKFFFKKINSHKNCDYYIITGGNYEWVNLILDMYYQKLKKYIIGHVYSVYNYNDKTLEKSIKEEKEKQIEYIIENFHNKKNIELLSFGDGEYERSAVISYSKKKEINFKNIKFIETPLLEQLIKQWNLICVNIDYLINYGYELDLMLRMKDIGETN